MLPAALVLVALSLFPEVELFKNLTFDQALAAALDQKKIVMIDFFTTWCAPCKKLDATTWKDAQVIDWAAQKCVALRFDAEKETALAKRFKIGAYPTILLLKPDGSEIDRLVGYRKATTFLSEVESALAGKDSLARAQAKLAGHESEPEARQSYAGALAQKGRYEDALGEYLWCFDHGRETPAYTGVRLSFLLLDIQRLGANHPPAIRALEERRDAAEARLVAGSESRDDVLDAVRLNETLKTPERSLALLDQMRAAKPLSAGTRRALLRQLMQPLATARRYADLLELLDGPEGFVADSIQAFEVRSKPDPAQDPDEQKLMQSAFKQQKLTLVRDGCTIHEALLGVQRKDEAAKVAERLIAFAPSGATWSALIDSASHAGAGDAAKSLAERALAALPEDEQGIVRRALKRSEKSAKPK